VCLPPLPPPQKTNKQNRTEHQEIGEGEAHTDLCNPTARGGSAFSEGLGARSWVLGSKEDGGGNEAFFLSASAAEETRRQWREGENREQPLPPLSSN